MKLLPLKTIAKIVGCSRQEAHRKLMDGERNIPYIRSGNEYLVDLKHVDKFKKIRKKRNGKSK